MVTGVVKIVTNSLTQPLASLMLALTAKDFNDTRYIGTKVIKPRRYERSWPAKYVCAHPWNHSVSNTSTEADTDAVSKLRPSARIALDVP